MADTDTTDYAIEYKDTPKFELFVKYYFDPTEKETHFNATKAAIKAYHLDPITQYGSAKVMGHENLTKLNRIGAREYLDQHGFTYEIMLGFALQEMTNSKQKVQWWDRLMEIAEWKKEKPNAQTLIQNNISVNTDIELNTVEEESLDKQFHDFIVSKAKAQSATLHPDTSNSSGV